jgi:amino acid transporter
MVFERSIGRYAILLAAIGGMVGSGWLLTPFSAVKIAGPAAIIAWPLAGIFMLFIAYTFIVLTRTLPIAGGTVRFLQLSHGHFVGFTFSWIAWLAWISVTPIEVLAVLQYTTNWLPSLMHKVNGSDELTLPGFELAVVLMVVMYLINIGGIKILSRANNLVVFFKLAIPIATLLLLFCLRFHGENFYVQGFMPMGIKGILAALPTAGVIYAMIGFNPAVQLAAEVKNPEKSIGFAIIGGDFDMRGFVYAVASRLYWCITTQGFRTWLVKFKFCW